MKVSKKCSKCSKIKGLKEFHKSRNHKDGLKPRCKICRNGDNKKHRKSNPEYYQKWRDEHKDEVKEHNKKYHNDNRESVNAARLERARQNPEHERKKKQEWYKKNKGKVLEGKRRRRDRQANCEENYTRSDERITLKAFSNKCFHCNEENNLHIDHHRPLVKGFGLSVGNAVVLCGTCNHSKGTKDPEKFYGTKICAKLDRKLVRLDEQVSIKKSKGV